MTKLGDFLKSSREAAKYSQKQAAKEIGITDSRLSRMERGINPCPPFELKKLASLYNVSVIDFYLKAGYLSKEDLEDYQAVFHGIDELDEEEKIYIQQGVDLLIRRKDQI